MTELIIATVLTYSTGDFEHATSAAVKVIKLAVLGKLKYFPSHQVKKN